VEIFSTRSDTIQQRQKNAKLLYDTIEFMHWVTNPPLPMEFERRFLGIVHLPIDCGRHLN
jgi:hypothetical protein